MKLIFLKDHSSKPKTLSISKSWIVGFASLFLCLNGLMVFIGMKVANVDEVGSDVIHRTQQVLPHQLHQELAEEKENIEELRTYLKNNLTALSARLGGLQAQVSRINAVEKRLANAAKIDIESFDFNNEPALGGSEDVFLSSNSINTPELSNDILKMEEMLAEREAAIKALGVSLSEMVLKEDQTPEGMPVKKGWISSRYGWRISPITGKKQFHKGVDIPSYTGADVLAVADGVVIRSEKQSAFGNVVEINHGEGMRTLYAHNSKNMVDVGESVSKGDKIAEVGSTGRSTGPHVHFQVYKNGKVVNPKPFLR